MSFNTIPPEIRAQIIEQLPDFGWGHFRLAQWAAISSPWRDSIEKYTFKHLEITSADFDEFEALFNGENISRRAALKTLRVIFLLPGADKSVCCDVEAIPDQEADSSSFSASVARLFGILSRLEVQAPRKFPFHLEFSMAKPGYYGYDCKKRWDDRTSHSRKQIAMAGTRIGQFQLVNEDAMCQLYGVTTFEFTPYGALSRLKPSSIPAMVERLHGLETLILGLEDEYENGRLRRHEQRQCFSASICFIPPAHIRQLVLNIWHKPLLNENVPVHKFVEGSQWAEDSWHRMIGHLSTFPSLAVLHLQKGLVICPEIFRSIADSSHNPFPSLQELVFEFAPETADGRWFYQEDDVAFQEAKADPEWEEFWEEEFNREVWVPSNYANYYSYMMARSDDPDISEDDFDQRSDLDSYADSVNSDDYIPVFEDEPVRTALVRHKRFKSVPDPTTFLPFLLDAVEALRRMPRLQKFILKMEDGRHYNRNPMDYPFLFRVFELWYLKAGTARSPKGAFPEVPSDRKYLHQNRLYWRVRDWNPWEEVQTAWSKAAGPEAKVVFLEEENFGSKGHRQDTYLAEF